MRSPFVHKMGAPRARTRNRVVDHDAQALRRKLSGRSRHRRRCSIGIRRTELQRIRAVTVGFDDDLYDIDDIRNQRPETSSYGLLTHQEALARRLSGGGAVPARRP